MIAALAAGVGARLCVHGCAGDSTPPIQDKLSAESSAPANSPAPVSHPVATEPRPEKEAVLSAHGAFRLRLLLAWLPEATDEELRRMADDLKRTATDESLGIRLLMARWAEVNPQALLSWAKAQPQTGYSWSAKFFYIENAIESWARADFNAAWAAAAGDLKNCRASALIGLTAVDPEKCLRFLAADPSLLDLAGTQDMTKVLARIASRNPAGAAALLESAPEARQMHLAASVAEAWAKSDPAAAVKWMNTLPADVRTADSMASAALWVAAHAPDQVPALLEELPAGGLRSAIVAADLKRLVAEDPAAARQRLDDMPPSTSRQYGRALLMQGLVHSGDIAGATEQARQLGWHMLDTWSPVSTYRNFEYNLSATDGGPGETPLGTMKDLVGRIATSDPKSAAAILATIGAEEQLAQGAALSNPAGVATALAAMPHDGYAFLACQAIVSNWASTDPNAVAAWMGTAPLDSEQRKSFTTSLFSSWSRSDPAAMVEWASQQGVVEHAWEMIPSSYRVDHLDDLLAENTTNRARDLLVDLPPHSEDARRLIQQMPDDVNVDMSSVVKEWLKDNAQAASGWVSELPGGLKKERATESLTEWLLYEERDYEAAFRWAATLSGGKGENLTAQALNKLNGMDPAKAEAAIRASSLSPEAQQRYLNSLCQAP
jgi:hypothetical protein